MIIIDEYDDKKPHNCNNGPCGTFVPKKRPVRAWLYETGRRLRWFLSVYWVESAMVGIALLTALLASCVTEIVEPEEVVTPDDLAEIAEAYCATHPELTCGHVYVCPTDPTTTSGGSDVELCVLDDTPLPSDTCTPTARHQGLCWWCCGEGCGAGCNAYGGCYCPISKPEVPVSYWPDTHPALDVHD